MSTAWHPLGAEPRYGTSRRRPEVGTVVAYDYRAWRVDYVQDAVPTDEETTYLSRYREEVRADIAPYRVTLVRLHGEPHPWESKKVPGRLALRATVSTGFAVYPDDRVPLCSCHQHPWPCLESEQQAEARKAMARAERELNLLPGCCPGCQEPVTHRQKSITFPGPYVNNPLAYSDPKFHLRRKCWSAAAAYEEAWVKAYPETAKRSLLTLRCEGSLIVHADGTADCHGAADSDCPSVYARHQAYSACYLQSHGCPRLECEGQHSHGCSPTGRPSDPRDLHGRAA